MHGREREGSTLWMRRTPAYGELLQLHPVDIGKCPGCGRDAEFRGNQPRGTEGILRVVARVDTRNRHGAAEEALRAGARQ